MHSIFSHNGARAARDRLSPCSLLPLLPHIHLLFFLQSTLFCLFPLSPLSDSFSFPILPLPCHLIQILPHLAQSPPPLLSIQSWSTDYTVTFCFILSQTPEGKPFQDISEQSNAPTLSLSLRWAHKLAHSTQHTLTHTQTVLVSFGFTRVSLTCHNW